MYTIAVHLRARRQDMHHLEAKGGNLPLIGLGGTQQNEGFLPSGHVDLPR